MTQDDDLLDFQLSDYITDTFTTELAEDINKAFELLYSFELQDVETPFLDLITSDSFKAQEDIQDNFTVILHEKLDYVIKEHGLTLIDNVSLSNKVQLLSALLLLMYLEDYSFILVTMESDDTDLEKLGYIISEYSNLHYQEFFSMVTDIAPGFLQKLKDYAYSKEELVITTPDESDKEIIDNLKLLVEMTGSVTIGSSLLKANVKPNLELNTYVSLIDDEDFSEVIKDIDSLSLNIFSILLLTRSNLNALLLIYRKNSHLFLDNINTVTSVEVKLIELLSKFLDFKRLKKESQK